MLRLFRQRNARLELTNANGNPDSLLAALHAERETAEEEARRQAEQEEDDALVAQHFAKIPAAIPSVNGFGKGKAKAADQDAAEAAKDEKDESGSESEEEDIALPSLTIKRRPAPTTASGPAQPSVATILAARGKVPDGGSGGMPAPVQAKRKREGMQKLLGIKKKVQV